MKKDIFVASFNYANNFYELFINEHGKIKIKKFSIGGNNNSIVDLSLSKIILNELLNLTKLKYGNIKYDNELFDVKYNGILNLFSFEKNVDGKKMPCNDKEFFYLNKIFNEPVYYFDSNNSFNSNNGFGNTSSFSGYNGFSSDDSTKLEEERAELERARRALKKKQKTKQVLVTIGSLTLVVCVSITGFLHYFKYMGKSENVNFSETSEVYVVDVNLEDIEEQIRESLEEEEDWVIESVIEQFHESVKESELGLEYEEQIKESKLNKRTREIIDIINNNPNIDEDVKQVLISNFEAFFNDYVQYYSNENYEEICEKIANLRVVKNYSNREAGIEGQYNTSENTIYLYCDKENVITHEFMHMLGVFSVVCSGRDFITEGYVELLNPQRNIDTYGTEQIMVIILGEIYGQEFMMKSFFGESSLMVNLYNKLGLSYDQDNPHWMFIRDELSLYLAMVQKYHYSELMSEAIKEDTLYIMERLKQEYETVTGKKWEDNEILKACFDLITQSNTLGLGEGIQIDNVYIQSLIPGYVKSKQVQYQYKDGQMHNINYVTAREEVNVPKR